MVASYGETSGFKAATAEDLMLINGGKGSSGSSNSGWSGSTYTATTPNNRKSVAVDCNPESPSVTATTAVKNGKLSVTFGASLSYSFLPPSVALNSTRLIFTYRYN
jgi:hypothetical protein